MPNLLSRNPFHTHHSSGNLNHANNHRHDNASPTTSSTHHHDQHHQAPTLKRSSKSFLNFISRKPSTDSIRSEKSNDSTYNSPTSTHNNHSGYHTDLGGQASPKQSHSMAELKRFFRPSMNKKLSMTQMHTSSHTGTNHFSPPSSTSTSTLNLNAHYVHNNNNVYPSHPHGSTDHHAHTQSAIPPSTDSILSLSNNVNIYHDDSILAQKYGKLGKLLGAGAGGSVKILVRPTDGVTFAVKEFRPRKPNESVKEYAKKCTAEFCIGSTLHHPNIVETVDIFSDSKQNKYFEVMQYCPVDFFAVVMTGKMSRGEINCCLKQLLEGVKYLHSMGLAHRDLKLDNCVMTEDGILKLIDFGSAVVFRYPFENEISMAHGIVGSDPYLAPEVITSTKRYDPQCVDIWSVGIIYCCMMLKRFPWKAPRDTDENFRLYCLEDDIEHDYVQSAKHHEQLLKERKTRRQRMHDGTHVEEKEEQQQTDGHQNASGSPDCKTNDGQQQTETTAKDNAQEEIPSKTIKAKLEEEKGQKEAPHSPLQPRQEQSPPPPPKEQLDNVQQLPTPQVSNTKAEKDVQRSPLVNEVEQCQGTTEQPNVQHQESATKSIGADSRQQGSDQKSIMSHKTTATQNHGPHPHHKKTIHGPYRLLRLLPHASRPIMSRILEVNPEKRATLEDIFNDEWFKDIPACTMNEKKQVIRAPGHHHTVVKEENAHLATYKV
ncbi:putative serine/threonine protein kinase HRK1 NDAI_0E00960 [Naumovozyma dairenensis CBS 421]|uniref:non-specific serine/threonine protein kinase n=1 Tax=Naumovozyma dairenensis (strain ATCC 10597 / BCRC 20456 / CBS 421 / NBRC 0211 / NRRL Y-12639) TaxID=1071378 RepID=G0WAZ2_NAUDC|nr:hypothetical protein NDAI_0E00960 [Naumovozyma dairenensis CBS 421]CCD24912.1 hypothetical protein NDAI_0E00960 [Naumovozyma dairenensis CBS 421]